MFNCNYPQLTYGHNYELPYHTAHNSDIISAAHKIAKAVEDERPFRSETSMFTSLQNALYFYAENPYDGPYNGLASNIDPETGLEPEPLGHPSQNEWDLMDSPIMNEVDDELSEY